MRKTVLVLTCIIVGGLVPVTPLTAAELRVGAASVDITPSQPVALAGQRHTRIARKVESPVTATVLVLETHEGEKSLDQAIMVSCDLVAIRAGIQQRFRERIKSRLPGFQIDKLFLNATHTHTAPVTREGVYVIPKEGVIQPTQYVDFLLERLEVAVVWAWQNRKPAGVGWGLGHAQVALNRRAVYVDGSARMYGKTNGPTFRGMEGYEDHSIDTLFFFNSKREVIAVAVNVACPAQEVESRNAVNADFWHELRVLLRSRFGNDVQVLAMIGASGDQSPHLMWYKRAEERMRKLRKLSRLQEIARRIDKAVAEAYQGAKQDIRFDLPFLHHVKYIQLPVRRVTEEEAGAAKDFLDTIAKDEELDPRKCLERMWQQSILDRYKQQDENPNYEMELHSIRLGDVAICTNPFELYTEYGVRIKARSQAVQTFVIQLACTSGGYLPTAEAIRGGHYSTAVYSNKVGPQGGDVLVDQTVQAINTMWESNSNK